MSFDDGFHRIGSDPLSLDLDAKEPARRLRGQLAAPVTVWTTNAPDGSSSGITVSSVLIADGETPSIMGLVAPLSDFWDAVKITKRFVVHVLSADQMRMADQFALRYPGDSFDGLSVSQSDHGPLLPDVATHAKCSLIASLEAGWSLLLKGSIDVIAAAADPAPPLLHYRGRYLTTGPRRN